MVSYRPHNVPFVALGATLLWFGWFGFNAGLRVRPRRRSGARASEHGGGVGRGSCPGCSSSARASAKYARGRGDHFWWRAS